MSLKAFHILFITISSAMAFGCGVWGLKSHFSPESGPFDLWFGAGCLIAGLGLMVYEIRFIKKSRGVSHL